MAVRLSLGAGRLRVVRQLLTESVLLASLSGALGVLIAVAGMRVLTRAPGQRAGGLHAARRTELARARASRWRCRCFAACCSAWRRRCKSTRPALMPMLRDRSVTEPGARLRRRLPRLSLTQVLVVAQIAISLLLLVAAGLFVRTLSNLQSIPLGFNREQRAAVRVERAAGRLSGSPGSPPSTPTCGSRLSEVPGVRDVTLSHASLIRAGRSHPITVDGRPTRRARGSCRPGLGSSRPCRFRCCGDGRSRTRDRQGTLPVAVVSDLFARTNFGDADPIGRHIEVGGSLKVDGQPARLRDRRRRRDRSIRRAQARDPAGRLRAVRAASRSAAAGDDLRAAHRRRSAALRRRRPPDRARGRRAACRSPISRRRPPTSIRPSIRRSSSPGCARAFAILALMIACVGLYATMAYAVARRTSEIGLRMALGAGRGTVIWMVLREVCVLAAVGLAIGVPTALATSRLVESFLFEMKPNDPRALALAAVDSADRGARGRLRTGAARVASRSDGRLAPRVTAPTRLTCASMRQRVAADRNAAAGRRSRWVPWSMTSAKCA